MEKVWGDGGGVGTLETKTDSHGKGNTLTGSQKNPPDQFIDLRLFYDSSYESSVPWLFSRAPVPVSMGVRSSKCKVWEGKIPTILPGNHQKREETISMKARQDTKGWVNVRGCGMANTGRINQGRQTSVFSFLDWGWSIPNKSLARSRSEISWNLRLSETVYSRYEKIHAETTSRSR